MDKPLVSISCIAYNHESYIRQCLDGFLMQKTTFSFEILIHDDASTDNSGSSTALLTASGEVDYMYADQTSTPKASYKKGVSGKEGTDRKSTRLNSSH